MKSNIGFGFIAVMLFTLFIFFHSGEPWLGLGIVTVFSTVAVILAKNGWRIGKEATTRGHNATPRGLTWRSDRWDLLIPVGLVIGFWGPFDGFTDDFLGFVIFLLGLFALAHKLWKEGKITVFGFLFALAIFFWFLSFSYSGYVLSEGSEVLTPLKDELLVSHGKEYYVAGIEAATYVLLRRLAYGAVIVSILGNEIAIYFIERKRR